MELRLIDLPTRSDERGSLLFAQFPDHIPFPVQRIFCLYDISPGAQRGAHAHRELHQFLIMLHGACTVHAEDGVERRTVTLASPTVGLYVPPMIWLELSDFAPQSVCAVLASDVFREADYIRSYAEFMQLARKR